MIHMQSGQMRPTEIAVFGERNSGTNLAHALLQQNIPAFENSPGDRIGKFGFRYGWKHGFPQMLAAPDTTLAICLFRHPETWLRSMHARPWHAGPDLKDLPFAEFIRTEWQTRVDETNFGVNKADPRALAELHWDRHPLTGERFENILALRNAKTTGFLSLRARFAHCLILRHEDITAAPEGFVTHVAQHYGVERRNQFHPVTDRRGRFTEGKFEAAHYDPLKPKDRDFVWSKLDRAQEKTLGYQGPS
ncbi:hypothetical protein [Roseovarius sp. 2305UL8-3]|uniref:hypothetical protein n=1 Tax=Roseovarius conchicola TaxID=3121636 RepID=UPI003526E840